MSEDVAFHSRRAVAAELQRRLGEPPPGRVQMLTGPRQVGKPTLRHQLASSNSQRHLRSMSMEGTGKWAQPGRNKRFLKFVKREEPVEREVGLWVRPRHSGDENTAWNARPGRYIANPCI